MRLVSAARSVIIVVVGTSLPARLVAGGRGRGAGSARPPCHGYAGPAGHAHRTRRPALLAGRLSCSFTPPPPPSPNERRTTPPLRGAYISLTRARSLYIVLLLLLLLLFFSCSSAAPSPQHLSFDAAATAQPSPFHKYRYVCG